MRVLVVGAGAIGSVLGGFLASGGHDVTLLGRAWHLDAIRDRGLRITGLWGDHLVEGLPLATDREAIERQHGFDWVFVCVKAHHTAQTAPIVERFLGRQTLVCAFQNGLGNYEALSVHLPSDRLALGRVIFGVELAPGTVHVTVCADEVLIGAPDPRCPRGRLGELAGALDDAGVPSRATTTIWAAIWAKVLYNCALNGLSTLYEVPYGCLPELPIAKRMIEALIPEAYRVAEAHRVALEPTKVSAYLRLLFDRLIPDTAAHQPSMLQDLRRGRLTEIEAMNGAIARMGAAVSVETPVNRLITKLVHTKEQFIGARHG